MNLSKLCPALLAVAIAAPAQPAPARSPDLHIFFADVEGGQATLFVTPAGESLLVDTGWPRAGGRDADRIVALCKLAGIARIDNVLVTHYHDDHVGGLPQLAARIPIGRFIDHGVNREDDNGPTAAGYAAYRKVLSESHAAHLTVKPGDTLPIQGMHVDIVSADGEVSATPLPGGGAQNPACAASPTKDPEASENDRSVGMRISFGRLRILDLGDLTWAKERPLMCPVDKLGRIDIYIVSHHGAERSGSPALLNAIAPRVAIMDNGATKGAEPGAWDIIQHSPRLQGKDALWQLHTAEHSDPAHNVPEARIANLAAAGDTGNWLELVAHPDGAFSLRNSRTGTTVDYSAP